jgi:hypothetical protein
MKKSYLVAEHCFTIQAPETVFECMSQYEPFLTVEAFPEVFKLSICQTSFKFEDFTEDYRQIDDGFTIVFGHTKEREHVFQYYLGDQLESWIRCSEDLSNGTLYLYGKAIKFSINNGLMTLFAFATSTMRTLFFHSAVVSYKGRGYMFLGKSGTGKSTHARLWLQHIEGAELVNDDNPVVRIKDNGKVYVYGSPWSGKTPCYRNVQYPVGGIVKLKQSQYNKIQRVKGIDAYMVIKRSAASMRWIKTIADGLHISENHIAKVTPIWFLECLPDEAAARLCQSEIAYEG